MSNTFIFNGVENLENLAQIVMEDFPYINSGGCCVFASIVGRKLEQLGIDVKGVVYAYNGDIDIDRVRGNLNCNTCDEWLDNGVSFNHIVLEFSIGGNVYQYDANGLYDNDGSIHVLDQLRGYLSVDEMTELAADNSGYWNTSFDRNLIPVLMDRINNYFQLFDNDGSTYVDDLLYRIRFSGYGITSFINKKIRDIKIYYDYVKYCINHIGYDIAFKLFQVKDLLLGRGKYDY